MICPLCKKGELFTNSGRIEMIVKPIPKESEVEEG